MEDAPWKSPASSAATLAAAVACVCFAAAIAWAASGGTASLGGIPIITWCVGLAFAIQWLAFVPAYLQETERFYDLTGSLTYLVVTLLALFGARPIDARAALIALLVVGWACRLGIFLVRRIRAAGSDTRFDQIKSSPSRFFLAWTLQGLWVFLTLCAGLAAMTTVEAPALKARDAVGLILWVLGFAIEVAADRQKTKFRREHPGRFIDTGLWAWSRHPNYFGEILLWVGVATIASSALRGWQWVTMISPVFVAVLLTRISGIPILEKRADERWGDDPAYRRYKSDTPVLIPRPPHR